MTLLEQARAGIITDEMKAVADKEGISPEFVRQGVADGTIVILHSSRPNITPVGVGRGMTTKVSASVGMYEDTDTIEGEMAKIEAAIAAKADTIMDLSVRGPIEEMREKVLSTVDRPVGTLPMYETLAETAKKYGTALDMTPEDMFEMIERQAAQGVSFLAMHPATTLQIIHRAKEEGRIDPLVSYGGSHLIGWMIHNNTENPMYTDFDRIVEICHKYDVVLSFADGMRPGAVADSLDAAQVEELVLIGTLVRRAREAGVQVMVKGPGHVALDEIACTVQLEKKLCHGAPYFVFGCLPTDAAAGFDHITSAIGGAAAAYAGADFLCYVTPAEHIGMPSVDDVYQGVMASRIAAHAGDVAKRLPSALAWDKEMSVARREMNFPRQFELSIDPETAERMWRERSTSFTSECTMCGKYCAMRIVEKYLRAEA
ncbi:MULTISPECIES: phosphomethylpyrimidine synthase ThiC [Eubacterium]|uniref:Phosphomethylpyrimidine synthase n=1 Tax=Eubacterium barkeri TaxID=1528 RepID=A0A1H3DIM6_EUBBA|nr:phosphomethylpyrimidine synthase ThiC [Eubacterium barkeri]SDX66241.1 phosphomethylpyrimidine synthase [Eubacterium barkeri]